MTSLRVIIEAELSCIELHEYRAKGPRRLVFLDLLSVDHVGSLISRSPSMRSWATNITIDSVTRPNCTVISITLELICFLHDGRILIYGCLQDDFILLFQADGHETSGLELLLFDMYGLAAKHSVAVATETSVYCVCAASLKWSTHLAHRSARNSS